MGETSVTISWEAPALNGDLVNYHINGGPTPNIQTKELTHTFTDLTKDKYYLISVSAQSTGGMGPASTVGPIFSATSKLTKCYNKPERRISRHFTDLFLCSSEGDVESTEVER